MQPLGSHWALQVADGDPAAGCNLFMRQINLIHSHLSASILSSNFWKGRKMQKKNIHKWVSCYLWPLIYQGVTKFLDIGTICTANFKKRGSLWSLIPKDFSAISDRGQVTLGISAWTFTANELHPALQFDCVCICMYPRHPTSARHRGHTLCVVNRSLNIVAEYQSTTIV